MTAIILCVLVVLLCIFYLKRSKQLKSKEPPVYSGSLPIIGITHLLLKNHLHIWETLTNIHQNLFQEGGLVTVTIGFQTYYLISDPQHVATVAQQCLQKSAFYDFVECWFGQGLFAAKVPTWKRHRKLLNSTFNLSVIHGFLDIFNNQSKKLLGTMNEFAEKDPVIVSSHIKKNILKTVFLTVFGRKFQQDEEILETYMEASHALWYLVANRVMKFWLQSDIIYCLSGQKKKQDQLVKILTDIPIAYIQKEVTRRKMEMNPCNDIDNGEKGVKTYLDMYLKLYENNEFTINDVREELNVTIEAAFDTTSIELETILIYIGSYPDVQERVFQEIIKELGENDDVLKEDLHKLVYTDAVIKETIRLASAAPVVFRYIDKDVQLSEEITLGAGNNAALILYGVNRGESWGPDADQFRPERWLEPGGVPSNSNNFATFGIGKRGCIGKTYAVILLKVYLVHFLRKYRVEADYTKIRYTMDGMLRIVGGNSMSLKLRNK